MKKLISILSVAVLSSCGNTTNSSQAAQTTFSQLTQKELSTKTTMTTKKNTKKVITLATQKHGIASWYGKQFHGKKTATGEFFDMNAMTAAHNTLPLDSYAEITNTENNKKVIVRINDRGPFVDNRVSDLSYFAAKQLGMDESGLSKVAIKTIAPEQALRQFQMQNQSVYLQVGTFNDKKAAIALLENLKKEHLPKLKIASSRNKNATVYKVQLPITSSRYASDLNSKLAKLGIKDTQFVAQTN